jgi:hypothetical protein
MPTHFSAWLMQPQEQKLFASFFQKRRPSLLRKCPGANTGKPPRAAPALARIRVDAMSPA